MYVYVCVFGGDGGGGWGSKPTITVRAYALQPSILSRRETHLGILLVKISILNFTITKH